MRNNNIILLILYISLFIFTQAKNLDHSTFLDNDVILAEVEETDEISGDYEGENYEIYINDDEISGTFGDTSFKFEFNNTTGQFNGFINNTNFSGIVNQNQAVGLINGYPWAITWDAFGNIAYTYQGISFAGNIDDSIMDSELAAMADEADNSTAVQMLVNLEKSAKYKHKSSMKQNNKHHFHYNHKGGSTITGKWNKTPYMFHLSKGFVFYGQLGHHHIEGRLHAKGMTIYVNEQRLDLNFLAVHA